jgi:hypothetical protein
VSGAVERDQSYPRDVAGETPAYASTRHGARLPTRHRMRVLSVFSRSMTTLGIILV